MIGSDGTLYFNTKIDSSGFQADMDDMKDRVNSVTDSINSGFAGAAESIGRTTAAIDDMGAATAGSFDMFANGTGMAIRGLRSTRGMITLLVSSIKSIGILANRTFSEMDLTKSAKSIKEYKANIEFVTNRIATLERELASMGNGKNLYGQDLVKYRSMTSELAGQKQELKEQNLYLKQQEEQYQKINTQLSKVSTAQMTLKIAAVVVALRLAISVFKAFKKKVEEARDQTKNTIEALKNFALTATKSFFAGWIKLVKGELNLVVSLFKTAVETGYAFAKKVLNISQSDLFDFLDAANGQTSKWALLLHEVQIRWQLIAATIGKALQNVFYPLLQIMNYALQGLQKIASYLAQITGAIFGDSSNLAAGLDDISFSSDDANQSLSDLNDTLDETKNGLAGFDKLNVLNQNDEKAEKFDLVAQKIKEAASVELVKIGKSDFINSIKEAVKNGDWRGVGGIIGAKLRDSLRDINWANIKENAKNVAYNLAETLNGFFKTPGLFTEIGRTIAEAINTALTTGNIFLETMDWFAVGRALADAFVEFLNTVDAEEAGNFIANLINMIIQSSAGFIDSFTKKGGWKKLGVAIVEGIKGVLERLDTSTISTMMQQLVEGFCDLLIALSTTRVEEKFKDQIGPGEYVTIFEYLGDALGKAFGDFVNNLDANKVAEAVKSFLSAIMRMVRSFFTSVGGEEDWKKLGTKVGDILGNIFDKEFLDELTSTVKLVVTDVMAMIEGVFESENLDWEAICKAWADNKTEIKKFKDGISELVSGVIYDLQPSIGTWFNKLFEGKSFWDYFIDSTDEMGDTAANDSFMSHLFHGTLDEWRDGFWSRFMQWWKDSDFDWLDISDEKGHTSGSFSEEIIRKGSEAGQAYSKGFTSESNKIETVDLTSPSDKFEDKGEESGKTYDTGVKKGIDSSKSGVKSSATQLGNDLTTSFTKSIDKIPDAMERTFKLAWKRVKAVFNDHSGINSIATDINNTFTGLINQLIDGLNNALVAPFNSLNDALNSLRWWSLDGQRPFAGLPYITMPDIPKLATGMYIPANYGNFMATLGDAKTPEIVSPVPAMKQAMKEVLAETQGAGGTYTFVAQLDGKVIFEETVHQDDMYQRSHGHSAFGG